MATELLELPDVPLLIELWCQIDGHEAVAEMTKYDPVGTAIIRQKPEMKLRKNIQVEINLTGICFAGLEVPLPKSVMDEFWKLASGIGAADHLLPKN